MSGDKKIVKLYEYRNRGKVLIFPKDRNHIPKDEFNTRLLQIQESLNKINELFKDIKKD